jgi:hypothetical protein
MDFETSNIELASNLASPRPPALDRTTVRPCQSCRQCLNPLPALSDEIAIRFDYPWILADICWRCASSSKFSKRKIVGINRRAAVTTAFVRTIQSFASKPAEVVNV